MNTHLKKLIFAAIMLAAAFLLPFLTANLKEIGNMLCPMHIPVLICGFVCGWKYGLAVGAIAPILRSLTVGMPQMFPNALGMMFELAVYGLMAGLLYKLLPKKLPYIYVALVGAMLAGRAVWGIVQFCCMGFNASKFGFAEFWAGAVANALPGIIIQIFLIPAVILLLEKTKLLKTQV